MANMQEMMDEAEQYLIHTYNRHQIVLDKGEGVYLYDVEGKQYLDFGAGIAVFALGYNNKEFNNALKAQVDKLIHTSNHFFAVQTGDYLENLTIILQILLLKNNNSIRFRNNFIIIMCITQCFLITVFNKCI